MPSSSRATVSMADIDRDISSGKPRRRCGGAARSSQDPQCRPDRLQHGRRRRDAMWIGHPEKVRKVVSISSGFRYDGRVKEAADAIPQAHAGSIQRLAHRNRIQKAEPNAERIPEFRQTPPRGGIQNRKTSVPTSSRPPRRRCFHPWRCRRHTARPHRRYVPLEGRRARCKAAENAMRKPKNLGPKDRGQRHAVQSERVGCREAARAGNQPP